MDYDLTAWPLCCYFLSVYLSKTKDPTNFPPDQIPAVFDKYEKLFESALQVLGLTQEALKSEYGFNFDSGHPNNLEGGIAILRVINALQSRGFGNIALVPPPKNGPSADLTCEKNGHEVCLEVKTITKQSSGRKDHFLEGQLYEKILENLPKARAQLEATAAEQQCEVKIFVCVVNWFDQSLHLDRDNYKRIVDRLKKDQEQESLKGVEGVLFVTGLGHTYLYLNERGKCIDY